MSLDPYEEEPRGRDQRQKQLDAIVELALRRYVESIAGRKPVAFTAKEEIERQTGGDYWANFR